MPPVGAGSAPLVKPAAHAGARVPAPTSIPPAPSWVPGASGDTARRLPAGFEKPQRLPPRGAHPTPPPPATVATPRPHPPAKRRHSASTAQRLRRRKQSPFVAPLPPSRVRRSRLPPVHFRARGNCVPPRRWSGGVSPGAPRARASAGFPLSPQTLPPKPRGSLPGSRPVTCCGAGAVRGRASRRRPTLGDAAPRVSVQPA